MKIIIIGDGKVGSTLVSHLIKEKHDITVVDNKANVVDHLVNTYDVMGICGSGTSYDILKEANAPSADLVIAATSSDEINIISCLISRNLGAKSTIARIRNYEYSMQVDKMRDDFGIYMTINPELEAANDIFNSISFPEALRVDSFGNGKVDLVELFIPQGSPLIGLSLAKIRATFKVNVLICAVQRKNEVLIPTGSFIFEAGDRIHLTATRDNIKEFVFKLGLTKTKIKNIMIIGGGIVSIYLAEKLINNKYNVKIIEKDYDKCKKLTEILPKTSIIYGDGSDQELLDEEGINQTDALVCLTNMDEENIIISMYADKVGVNKIIAKVDKSSFRSIVETIGNISIVSPKSVTANRIISYVRNNESKHAANILTLYKLVNNTIEALEFKAVNTKVLNIPLKDLRLKQNILIASIIRDNNVIIPSGMDSIQENDLVIAITKETLLEHLDDILE